jgi:hypothetical protein
MQRVPLTSAERMTKKKLVGLYFHEMKNARGVQ